MDDKDRKLIIKIAKELDSLKSRVLKLEHKPGEHSTALNVDFYAQLEKPEIDNILKALDTSIRAVMKQAGIKRLRCDISAL